MARKYDYQEMLPHELEAAIAAAPAAYLALGTLEYHGPHMAVGNDALKAEAILRRACARTGGVMIPTLYWGIGGGHKEYPASIIIRDSILGELLDDILAGLYRNGLRVYVLLTGHYPGEQVEAVKGAAARLRLAHPEIRIWALPEHEAFPGELRGDHAAKWETSILQHLRPELVDLARIAAAAAPGAPDATRTLEEMNAPGPLHGILGENPARTARAELGEETVRVIVDQIVEWVTNSLAEVKKPAEPTVDDE
jgi:creatinine amidohydrolase